MRKMLGCVALAALAAAGCGGDDGGEGDIALYCELVEESESSSVGFPTAEEVEELLDAAPEEIRDDIETLTDAFADVEDPDDVEALLEALDEPEVADAIEELEDFDAEHCGDASESGSGSGSGSASAPADGDDDEEDDEDDEQSGGDLCEQITDEQVSEIVGVELSSEDTLFNNEDNCEYRSADEEAELFLSRLDSLGQSPRTFLETAEINFDDFEELDGIGEAAYFITSEFSGAMAGALDGDVVLGVTWDDGGDDPAANRDVAIELLELLADA